MSELFPNGTQPFEEYRRTQGHSVADSGHGSEIGGDQTDQLEMYCTCFFFFLFMSSFFSMFFTPKYTQQCTKIGQKFQT